MTTATPDLAPAPAPPGDGSSPRWRPAALLQRLGSVLIAAGVVGLALLAAGQPTTVEEPVVTDQAQAAAQPGGEPRVEPALAQPSPQPAPAATEATAPPERTPLPTVSPARVLLDESFSDNRMRWPDNSDSTAWITSPGYRLVPRWPGQFVAIRAPIPVAVADVLLEATFRKLDGPAGGGYGLIVRDQATASGDGIAQGGRYDVLEVSDRGQVGVWRREEDHWVDLLPWTDTPAVHQGQQPNTLRVWAVGQRLTLWVNGAQVASQVDDVLTSGGVGVFVGGDGNDVQLDRLLVRVAGDGATEASEMVPLAANQASGGAQPQPTPAAETSASPATPSPGPGGSRPVTRLVIASIALDAPSVPAELVKQNGVITWAVPPFKVGHAQETGGAGGPGNAVLVGHVNSRDVGNVFEHLHQVRPGDAIQVFSGDQQFDYRVTEVRTVARTDVSVVQATSRPALTLITCTGPWLPLANDYAQRVVVRAELVPAAPEQS